MGRLSMSRPNRGCLVLLLGGALCALAGPARAEDPPPPTAAAATAPAAPPAEHRFTGDKPAYFISGGVADNPYWTLGTTLPQGVTLSVGLSVDYDSDGLLAPGA